MHPGGRLGWMSLAIPRNFFWGRLSSFNWTARFWGPAHSSRRKSMARCHVLVSAGELLFAKAPDVFRADHDGGNATRY